MAPWAQESPGSVTTPDPLPRTLKSNIKWETVPKLGITNSFGGKKKSSFGRQIKVLSWKVILSPSSDGKIHRLLPRNRGEFTHRSPYFMSNGSCRYGISAFCGENFSTNAMTLLRISETCQGFILCVKTSYWLPACLNNKRYLLVSQNLGCNLPMPLSF